MPFRANQDMIKDTVLTSNGIGVSVISQLSDGRRRIIVRALVSEKSLPKEHDELKTTLLFTAYSAVGSIASEFGLSLDDKSALRAVRVEFISIESRLKETRNGVGGYVGTTVYADLNDGELTFI